MFEGEEDMLAFRVKAFEEASINVQEGVSALVDVIKGQAILIKEGI